MTDKLEPPEGWGRDSLSEFIDSARHNTFGTFATHPRVFHLLADVDAAFRKALNNVSYSKDWLPAAFLLRAHSCFLGATRLVVSGQLAEAYMVLRGCIEASLYAHFLFRDPLTRAQIWFNRHESADAHKLMRNTFTHGAVVGCLKQYRESLAERVGVLYDRTIDYGGHPNERGLLQSMGLERTESQDFELRLDYLAGDTLAYRFCLKTVFEAALSSLDVFALVFWERFSLVSLRDDLEGLRKRVKHLAILQSR